MAQSPRGGRPSTPSAERGPAYASDSGSALERPVVRPARAASARRVPARRSLSAPPPRLDRPRRPDPRRPDPRRPDPLVQRRDVVHLAVDAEDAAERAGARDAAARADAAQAPRRRTPGVESDRGSTTGAAVGSAEASVTRPRLRGGRRVGRSPRPEARGDGRVKVRYAAVDAEVHGARSPPARAQSAPEGRRGDPPRAPPRPRPRPRRPTAGARPSRKRQRADGRVPAEARAARRTEGAPTRASTSTRPGRARRPARSATAAARTGGPAGSGRRPPCSDGCRGARAPAAGPRRRA